MNCCWSIVIPYLGFGAMINIISKGTTPTMLQLKTSHNAHPKTSPRCPLMLWERKRNECIANIFTICSNFYARWTITTSTSFTLQHIPSTKSCNHVGLSVLLNTNTPFMVFSVTYNSELLIAITLYC